MTLSSAALQVCALSAGTQGYLRRSKLKDLSTACRASPSCRAIGLAQLRIDRTKLGDGVHPTKAGVPQQRSLRITCTPSNGRSGPAKW